MTPKPRYRAGAAALWAAAGAAFTLLAVEWLDDTAGTSSDSAVPDRRETTNGTASAAAEQRASGVASTTAAAPLAVVEAQRTAVERVGTASPPVPASNPIVGAPPSNSPVARTDLPNRRNDDPSGSAPATNLLDSARISCDFGPGNNTGTRVGDVLTVSGGAQWQGGLILYDFTNADAGTARMTGTPGVTGSPSGEAKVQVTTEGTRVFLSGFLANGAYVMVTIFDELDNVGRHIAVMSRHESVFAYASQFLGTCE